MTMYPNGGNPVRAQYYTGADMAPANDAPVPAEKPQEQREHAPDPTPAPTPQLQAVPNVIPFPQRAQGTGMKWLMWATAVLGIIIVFMLLMSVPTEEEERRERRHAPSRRSHDWLDDDDDGFNPFREGRGSGERRESRESDRGERRGERASSSNPMSGIVPPIIINNPGMPPTVVPGSRAGD